VDERQVAVGQGKLATRRELLEQSDGFDGHSLRLGGASRAPHEFRQAAQNVALMKMHGVAFFKDGRVASKNFVFNVDYNKGAGPFFGYSTYQFEDGSSITARFAGTQRTGQPVHGEYTVLSGTGTYAGAKGTGTFDAVPHKLTGANLLSGKFSITTP